MTPILVLLIVLAVFVGIGFAIFVIARRAFGLRKFMNQVVSDETARPQDPNAPRGAGGLTAAQTTAMAQRMLGGLNFHQNSRMPIPEVIEKPSEITPE